MCESTINEALEILSLSSLDLEEALETSGCETEAELVELEEWAQAVIDAASDEERREQNEKETVYGT